jgi:hypothetical protein
MRGNYRGAAAIAGIICLLVYLRALSCGFVSMDDPDYVLNNAAIRRLDGPLLSWAFGAAHAGFWMPLTWLSLAFDYRFWGLNPAGYHLTNILLHAVNTGLVVLVADAVCRRMDHDGDGEGAAYPAMLLLAGLLFGIHPLRVESVAWVTERKDVLNGLFTLGSLLCYLRYTRWGGERGAGRYYLLSIVLFACSLMAKSVSVVLPAILLVLDRYPLRRLTRETAARVLAEKVPFLVLSLCMAVATVRFAAGSDYLVSYDIFPFAQRLVVSGNAVYEYVRLLLAPVGILPLWVIPDPLPPAYTATSLLSAAACIGILAAWKNHPLVTVWLCFLIPLLPVLAFLQNGDQSYAARFTYLPSVAPAIAAALLIRSGVRWLAGKGYRYAGIAAVVVLLAGYGAAHRRLAQSGECLDADHRPAAGRDLPPGTGEDLLLRRPQ